MNRSYFSRNFSREAVVYLVVDLTSIGIILWRDVTDSLDMRKSISIFQHCHENNIRDVPMLEVAVRQNFQLSSLY